MENIGYTGQNRRNRHAKQPKVKNYSSLLNIFGFRTIMFRVNLIPFLTGNCLQGEPSRNCWVLKDVGKGTFGFYLVLLFCTREDLEEWTWNWWTAFNFVKELDHKSQGLGFVFFNELGKLKIFVLTLYGCEREERKEIKYRWWVNMEYCCRLKASTGALGLRKLSNFSASFNICFPFFTFFSPSQVLLAREGWRLFLPIVGAESFLKFIENIPVSRVLLFLLQFHDTLIGNWNYSENFIWSVLLRKENMKYNFMSVLPNAFSS